MGLRRLISCGRTWKHKLSKEKVESIWWVGSLSLNDCQSLGRVLGAQSPSKHLLPSGFGPTLSDTHPARFVPACVLKQRKVPAGWKMKLKKWD